MSKTALRSSYTGPVLVFSVAQFCEAHNISQAKYYEMKAQGLGPVEMRVGRRRLVSAEAARDWRRQRERETAAARPAITTAADTGTVGEPTKHAGGRDPENDWEGAVRHVDEWVADRGPLPLRKDGKPNVARAVELMTEWFKKNEPPAPPPSSIYRWLRDNLFPAWWM